MAPLELLQTIIKRQQPPVKPHNAAPNSFSRIQQRRQNHQQPQDGGQPERPEPEIDNLEILARTSTDRSVYGSGALCCWVDDRV